MSTTAIETQKLHLGCGRTILPEWINLDCVEGIGVDAVFDLDSCATSRLPFEDNQFDEVFASHLIEHIKNPLPMMQELHRVCVNGAVATFRCPHGASDDAFEDPTHFRQYFANSFMYFSQPAYWRADYGYRGDWQVERIQFAVHGKHRTLEFSDLAWRVEHLRNMVSEMVVTMHAVKPIRPPERTLLRVPTPEVVFFD